MTTQLAELRRAELLAEATSHRLARTRTTPSALTAPFSLSFARLRTALSVRRSQREPSNDLDVAAACCGVAA